MRASHEDSHVTLTAPQAHTDKRWVKDWMTETLLLSVFYWDIWLTRATLHPKQNFNQYLHLKHAGMEWDWKVLNVCWWRLWVCSPAMEWLWELQAGVNKLLYLGVDLRHWLGHGQLLWKLLLFNEEKKLHLCFYKSKIILVNIFILRLFWHYTRH